MTSPRKYIDVDDYGNIENVIKKVEPSYVDITKFLPGPIANFAQQQMSLAISTAEEQGGDSSGIKPHQLFLMMKKERNNAK